MSSFHIPDWASQPCRVATLEIHLPSGGVDKVPVDAQPHYLFGRAAESVDVHLDHASCSRVHAALVHHNDGRLFLIDLGSTHGTVVDRKPLSANKPHALKDGCLIKFGAHPNSFTLRCESAAEKRRNNNSDHKGAMNVRASHLLVKHKDVRRPSSWKEPVVTRTKEEALEMIVAFREQLVRGDVTFAELASKESHCSSASRGGDLGEFGPGQMQKAFEDATYALKVGELSQPVISDSGVHLILRTG